MVEAFLSYLSTMPELFPELFLIASGLLLLVTGVRSGHRGTLAITMMTISAMVIAVYILCHSSEAHTLLLNDLFYSDGFTRFAKVLVLLGSVLVLILAASWLGLPEHRVFEFPLVMLFATIGLMLMISANDLMSLYMGLEMSSLSLYVLAAFSRDSLKSTEAGLKYFVLGSLASGMLLFGASLIYGFSGTTNFSALSTLFATSGDAPPHVPIGLMVGIILFMIGIFFKLSAVPFHMWTPDVYEGAPTPVTAYFAVAPKIAMMALFARVLTGPFGELLPHWQPIVILVAIGSMLVGAFGAIVQTNIKRLLAYSSIGHVGYALIGIAAGTDAGITGMLVYLMLYLFMSVGTFGCVMMMRRHGQPVETIADLAGLSKTRPSMAFALALFMFSMTGIPPLAGFFGKMYVFLGAVEAGLITLAVVGVVTSVVAAYYYLKIVKIMYFDAPKPAFDSEISPSLGYVVAFCGLVTALFFVYPSPFMAQAKAAAEALFQ